MRLRNDIDLAADSITDLAAEADIEDVMLCDFLGVVSFLGLPPNVGIPRGGKGKAKMKKLFRMVALNNAYHEGNRARPLIKSLDMNVIKSSSPVPLEAIDKALL